MQTGSGLCILRTKSRLKLFFNVINLNLILYNFVIPWRTPWHCPVSTVGPWTTFASAGESVAGYKQDEMKNPCIAFICD
jgi:hypothetical protein